MCVVAYKRKGLSVPLTSLQPLFEVNKDGVGFSYTCPDGSFKVAKAAVFTWVETLDFLERECPDWGHSDSRSVIHFRIGTSGGRRVETCHPFPMTPDIRAIDSGAIDYPQFDCYLYHNGVVSGFNPEWLKKYSDTQLLAASLASHTPAKWREYLDKLSDRNRFLLHWRDGAVEVFGPWHDWDGLRVSNLNFQSRHVYGGLVHYDCSGWDGWDNWDKHRKPKPAAKDSKVKPAAKDSKVKVKELKPAKRNPNQLAFDDLRKVVEL